MMRDSRKRSLEHIVTVLEKFKKFISFCDQFDK